ncbi:hypothetical protein DN593_26715 [Klebsiella pneumoniae]|nr:hypothetical protein [Escherichia coli]RWT66413.1 hypothetical protein DN593_26715 [Klebsiella pneumoniae]
MRQGMLTPEYRISIMKISLDSVFERVMACSHLRAITWLIIVSFCIVFWGYCIFYGLKAWELLLTMFKVA